MSDRLILLPGDAGFQKILASPIPGSKARTFVVRQNSGGILEECDNEKELDNYLYGGEHDEVMSSYEDDNNKLNNNLILLPESYELDPNGRNFSSK